MNKLVIMLIADFVLNRLRNRKKSTRILQVCFPSYEYANTDSTTPTLTGSTTRTHAMGAGATM